MEDDQNGRRPKWKTTKMEDDQMKDDQMKDDQNGRCEKTCLKFNQRSELECGPA